MAGWGLTGFPNDYPIPGYRREFRPASGSNSGAVAARDALIAGNKLASVGSASVDGLGSAVNTPVLILGGEEEVIARYGRKSELYANYMGWVDINKTTMVWMAFVALGTGTATVDTVFATTSNVQTALLISCDGETIEVPVGSTDTPTVVAALARDYINAKTRWMITATASTGTLTTAASMAGTRHEHQLNKLRFAWRRPNAMTVTKGAVTPGTTDDDWTTLISGLGAFNIYYHVCPKVTTISVTPTDNGIGEYITQLTDLVSPTGGKNGVLFIGTVGTVSQAVTTSVSVNKWFFFNHHAKDNDWTCGRLAVHLAAILGKLESSNRAPNLASYGIRRSSDTYYVPDPFDPFDRPTETEQVSCLNNGVTPACWTSTGKAYLAWYVTGQSETNSVKDYRARPGHLPSVMFDFDESVSIEVRTQSQDNWGGPPPAEGQPRLPNFDYTDDIAGIARQMIDIKTTGGNPTLDPSMATYMKDSIQVQDIGAGYTVRVDIRAVRHNLHKRWLFLETSPPV